jgi:UDP-glucose 4-epimerase
MKILLTGANGFAGSHLARVLVEEGAEVLRWFGRARIFPGLAN